MDSNLDRLRELQKELAERDRLLEEEVARKQAILDSSLDAIVTIDGDSTILEWNKAAERIFGFTAEESLGQPLFDLIIPVEYRLLHQQGMERWRKTGKGVLLNRRIEIPALCKDGRQIMVELAIAPVSGTSEHLATAQIRELRRNDE